MANVIVTHLRPKVSEGKADNKETDEKHPQGDYDPDPCLWHDTGMGFCVLSMDVIDVLLPKLMDYAFTRTN